MYNSRIFDRKQTGTFCLKIVEYIIPIKLGQDAVILFLEFNLCLYMAEINVLLSILGKFLQF